MKDLEFTDHNNDFPSITFPEETANTSDESELKDLKSDKVNFTNQIFQNDSLTRCSGFINAIKKYQKNNETIYFVRVGLLQGSKKEKDGSWSGDITNCELIAGKTIKHLFKNFELHEEMVIEMIQGVRCHFEIRNLKYSAIQKDGKAFLNAKGIIESVKFGYIKEG